MRRTTGPRPEHLAGVELFRGCTSRQLHRVLRLADTVTAAPGEVVCRRHEVGHRCFVLLDGTVRVDGTAGPARRLGPGEAFGELALLGGLSERRVADVVVETEASLLVFEGLRFWELLRAAPTVHVRLLETVSATARDLAARAPTEERPDPHPSGAGATPGEEQ